MNCEKSFLALRVTVLDARAFARRARAVDTVQRACMATKTISVDLEAYHRLVHARRHSHESFSQVIKRAQWAESDHTGATILAGLERLKPLDDAYIRELDTAQKLDNPPRNKWRKTSRATRRS
jgi:hypothetical protein